MGVTAETGGTRFKGIFDTFAEACEALTQLMADFPNGFFNMQDEGREPHRRFRFTYFPGEDDPA